MAAGTMTAAGLLATLLVKGRAPMTGYSRDQYGAAWTDANSDLWGRNGLDTRNDILSRDLTQVACKSPPTAKSAPHCSVLSGVLHDPYTGKTISFVRGETSSLAVQIDHVVALGDSWQTGAQNLTPARRIDLANDPLELISVDGPTNLQKGDGDAATWLPPNKSFRCSYVARQIAVKAKYDLWVTPAEKAAMTGVLSTCGGLGVPSADARPGA
jgi:hypothetical protein